MTDRDRKMIEAYLPHPRDPELGKDEYFVLDTAGRVQHVRLTDIFPGRPGEDTEYGVRRVSDGMRIDSGYGDPFRGFCMFELYDNRKDCRNRTHGCYGNWEHLRLLQREEADGIDSSNEGRI